MCSTLSKTTTLRLRSSCLSLLRCSENLALMLEVFLELSHSSRGVPMKAIPIGFPRILHPQQVLHPFSDIALGRRTRHCVGPTPGSPWPPVPKVISAPLFGQGLALPSPCWSRVSPGGRGRGPRTLKTYSMSSRQPAQTRTRPGARVQILYRTFIGTNRGPPCWSQE